MTEPSPRFWELFFELFESLPRQGPGNRSCTERALAICVELPNSPDIVDLGCGSGAGSLHLAELTRGSIVAIDSHGRSIERLQQIAKDRGLDDRIRALVGDMSSLDLPDQSFDLVWSEGALYNLGLDAGLGLCRRLLRPGGYLAFTDAVWLASDPPAEVRAAFEADYPTMGTVDTVLAAIERAGLELVDHFTLPDEAWWDDFYGPMEARIDELRTTHEGDDEALAILDELAGEPKMHRQCAGFYGYQFFVAQRYLGAPEPTS